MDYKQRILLIEDEADMLRAITIRLEANNYEVLTARDGQAGLEKARQEKPDLIIMDIMLPKMDGFTLCRMLKYDMAYQHIPIIILTARIQEADRNKGQEVGADAYVTKPYKSDELLGKTRELLDKK